MKASTIEALRRASRRYVSNADGLGNAGMVLCLADDVESFEDHAARSTGVEKIEPLKKLAAKLAAATDPRRAMLFARQIGELAKAMDDPKAGESSEGIAASHGSGVESFDSYCERMTR